MLINLARPPAPTSPKCMIELQNDSRTGSTLLNVSLLLPTNAPSSAASACNFPPATGDSANLIPCNSRRSARSLVCTTDEVPVSTTRCLGFSEGNTSSITLFTSAEFGKQRRMMSLESTASRFDSHSRAPCSTSNSTGRMLRCTVTETGYPALSRFEAIPNPIAPNPNTAILSTFSMR